MTTSNQIVTNTFENVLSLPLEAIHAQDSLSFVYTKKGKKQIVVTGEMNENFIIIEKGVKSDEEIYLSIPTKPESFDLIGQELIPVIKEKIRTKRFEEEKLKVQQTEEMNPRNVNFGKNKVDPKHETPIN